MVLFCVLALWAGLKPGAASPWRIACKERMCYNGKIRKVVKSAQKLADRKKGWVLSAQSLAKRLLWVREYDDKKGAQGLLPPLESFYRTGLTIAGPATAEGVLASLVGSVDTMMVGALGPAAIAAIGLTNQPRMILLILVQSLCIGATAVIARRKGQGNADGIERCFRQTLLLGMIAGILITLVGNLLCEPILKIAGANEDTLELSCQYFRIINGGIMFNCITLVVCASLRGLGKTKVTMVTNITANLVNLVFNYLLISGNFGFPALGVRGAAIATVIGNAAGCGIALHAVLKKESPLPLKLFKKWSFDRETLGAIKQVSLASIGENVFLRLGFLINSIIVAKLGTNAFAAYQIVTNVTTLSFTLGDGLSVAGASLVGQSLGQERPDIALIYCKTLRRLSVFLSAGLMLFTILFRFRIAALFTQDPVVISYVVTSFWVAVLGMVPQNGRVVYSGCLHGAGDTGFVAKMALLSVAFIRPLSAYIFCFPLGMEVAGAWLSFVLDALVRDFAFTRRLAGGKWARVKL